jgi:hypothetical protein
MESNPIPYLLHLPWMILALLGVVLTIALTWQALRKRSNFRFIAHPQPSGLMRRKRVRAARPC